MADTVHQADIKGQNVQRAVRVLAQKLFKLKQLASMSSSSDWSEVYYRETQAPIDVADAGTGISLEGVPRLTGFPHVDPSWTKVTTYNKKFAAESTVSIEDNLTSAIDVQARTITKVAQAIASKVDSYIYTELTAEGSTSGVVASNDAWNSATLAARDAIGDILIGIAAMEANNYDVRQNGFLLLSPTDYGSLLRDTRVMSNVSFKTADVVSNGVVGQICGLKIIVSTSVTADEAMIVMGQTACRWKSVTPLTSSMENDPGISDTIRSWEIGHLEITDPLALYTITNTQA